ncbi:MAG: DUF1574 domain-containing protein [Spirochaetota bacterium]
MLKNRFLFLPVLMFLLVFLIDKLMLLEKVQTYFSKTLSEANYLHKPILFQELQEYLQKKDRKKVLVYFGNSRGLLFNNKYIAEHYPDWLLFNFSVPGGTPDYSYFWLEQFQEKDVRPDFILLDNSVESYNLDAKIKIDEVLVNGLTLAFVLRHYSRYTKEDVSNLIAKRMFPSYQYRPNPKTALKRMKNDFEILHGFRYWRERVRIRLQEERGSAAAELSQNPVSSEENIKAIADGDFKSYMSPFRFNHNMLFFLENSISTVKEMKIPLAIIWVKVAPYYLHLMKTKKVPPKAGSPERLVVYEKWSKELSELYKKIQVSFWNMNEDPKYQCNQFADASHMATSCYPDYTDYIFQHMGVAKK